MDSTTLPLLSRYCIQTNYLTLEVTESQACQNLARTLDSMTRLRLLGVNISIDDFGTGHSSLNQLITAPYTELKIDRSFVNNMFNDDKNLAAVKASVSLAHSIGLEVVAEGVETEAQAKELKRLGCDTLQGFLYSKPLSTAQFEHYITENATTLDTRCTLSK